MKKRFIDLMICFGLSVFLFFLSHNVYADVYEVSIPISILTSYFIITIIDLIRIRSYANKSIRIFTIILLVSSVFFMLMFNSSQSRSRMLPGSRSAIKLYCVSDLKSRE